MKDNLTTAIYYYLIGWILSVIGVIIILAYLLKPISDYIFLEVDRRLLIGSLFLFAGIVCLYGSWLLRREK